MCLLDRPACVSSGACELTSESWSREVPGTKKGSIFNSAMVPLPLRTWLLWACGLGAGVAHSVNVHALRTVQGMAQSLGTIACGRSTKGASERRKQVRRHLNEQEPDFRPRAVTPDLT